MSRKTVGLYKRYSFSFTLGIWAFYFKRPLYWAGRRIPVILIPSDLVSDFEEFTDFNGREWEITLKRSSTDTNGFSFFTRACPGMNYPGSDPYIFPIPVEFHSILESEGIDKKWCVSVLPYESNAFNVHTKSKGVLYSVNIEHCAKIHGEHYDNIINRGYNMGDLFNWLYGKSRKPGRRISKDTRKPLSLIESLRKGYSNVEVIVIEE